MQKNTNDRRLDIQLFGTTFGAKKLFSKKNTTSGKRLIFNTSRVLYIPLYPTSGHVARRQ